MTKQTKTKILMLLMLLVLIVVLLPGQENYTQNVQFADIVQAKEVPTEPPENLKISHCSAKNIDCGTYYEMYSFVTGYNTVPEQTDSTPCWAGGYYICGRDDVTTCPRAIPKETIIEIRGKKYECLDRTHTRYDNRFDISCDKDMECPYKVTGWTNVKIYDKK